MAQRMIPILLIAAAPLGCATMSRGESHTDDKVLRIEQTVQASGDVSASVEQSGSVLHVQAMQKCDLVELKRIRRTTRYDKKNEALAPEVVLLTVGAIPAAIGVGMVVDSKNVYEHDRQSRTYNAAGPGAALGGGIALLTLGAAMMAVPVVDLFRTIGSETEENEVTEPGLPIQRDVPCRSATPMAYQSVTVMDAGLSFGLGSTDATGALHVDLATAIPASVGGSQRVPPTMRLFISGRLVGKVDMASVIEARRVMANQGEDEAWQSIDSGACRSRRDPAACQQVKSFLMRFPDGARAREALRILDPSASGGIQIAASPEDVAKAEAAQKAAAEALEKAKKEAAETLEKAQVAAEAAAEKAQQAAAEACKKKCQASCKKDAVCTKSCVEEVCP